MAQSSMNLKEFAQFLGITLQATYAGVRKGRVPTQFLEKRPAPGPSGFAFYIKSPEAAREAWHGGAARKNTNAATLSINRQLGVMQKNRQSAANEEESEADDPLMDIITARKVYDGYRAKQTKLEYEQAVGRLVSAEQVKLLFGKQIQEAKTKVMLVARHARSQIPHLTIEDVEVIERLCAEALESLTETALTTEEDAP